MMARSSLQAVLFDLDGTLLDTAPDFARVLELMTQQRQMASIPYQRIRETVSDGARALVTMAFGLEPDDSGFELHREELLTLYNQHLGDHTRPFDGIEALLETLALWRVQWGVVTNKPSWLAEPLLQRIGLTPPLAVLVCPDHVTRTKPDPEPLLLACQRLGVDPTNCVYVGDHDRDIVAGKSAGMTTIAAAYGYVDNTKTVDSWQADFKVEHASAILPVLEHHYSRH